MDYSNVLTDLTWIFVIVATILILIEFRGIIEDFQVKGHIQGRRIQYFWKEVLRISRPIFSNFHDLNKYIFQEERGSNQYTHGSTYHWYYLRIPNWTKNTLGSVNADDKVYKCSLIKLIFYQ